jgi:hypothetical protein
MALLKGTNYTKINWKFCSQKQDLLQELCHISFLHYTSFLKPSLRFNKYRNSVNKYNSTYIELYMNKQSNLLFHYLSRPSSFEACI